MKSHYVLVSKAAIDALPRDANGCVDSEAFRALPDTLAAEAGIDLSQYRCICLQVKADGNGYEARYDHKDQQYRELTDTEKLQRNQMLTARLTAH